MNRQKSDLEQLKSKLPGASRRRFDPSKAFQHNKENMENKENEANEALREGENRGPPQPSEGQVFGFCMAHILANSYSLPLFR